MRARRSWGCRRLRRRAMSRMTRALSFTALCAFLLSACGVSLSGLPAGARRHATFQTENCPFKAGSGVFKRSDIRCGYLVVPESRQRDSGKTIKVAVAIFKATRPNPAPDPLVYLSGGPGGAIIT